MQTVTLCGIDRFDPPAIPPALRDWLGPDVAFTTRREGDQLHVVLTAAPDQLPSLSASVVRFFVCWRRTCQGRTSPPPLAPDDSAFVDPAAHSYDPGPWPRR